ncbi:uncharacterized protein LOC110187936 isoform X1 [Drosophila serrata]|uniref:uncharacterized protein LOC110187936 isoform X1 n=1 Tax=Drosophila serrata TaxID=7274 RepID=UPI000A1D2CFF|nr:uncharacterized protein LOC110187936 isoform X1 [Drosophila serrata]XP_020813108.1 uncharacterized protein LOC110187936 isoform X1 [Drosophila serrata]XP_020813109.1 uncharacterized protein LOC110187936 isoform X1 [Drosophila serrata]
MMKATAWFCPVLLTLLCATGLVCTAQRGGAGAGPGPGPGPGAGAGAEVGGSGRTNGYPLDYTDARNIQDDFLLVAKRNKPSLSIVNPLDVLRQRLLLEIARRQMKENSRQVELNRAILKNVGKRVLQRPGPKVSSRFRQQWPTERELELERQLDRDQEWEEPEELRQHEQEQSQQHQLSRQQLLLPWQHFPSQLWSYRWPQSPSQFADSTRTQSLPEPKQLLSYAKKSLDVAGMGLASRHRANGNEAANETSQEHESEASKSSARYVGDEEQDDDANDNENDIEAGLEGFEPNWTNEEAAGSGRGRGRGRGAVGAVNANDRLPWTFPYRFHRGHNVN